MEINIYEKKSKLPVDKIESLGHWASGLPDPIIVPSDSEKDINIKLGIRKLQKLMEKEMTEMNIEFRRKEI